MTFLGAMSFKLSDPYCNVQDLKAALEMSWPFLFCAALQLIHYFDIRVIPTCHCSSSSLLCHYVYRLLILLSL